MKTIFYLILAILLTVAVYSPKLVGEWRAEYEIAFFEKMNLWNCLQQAEPWECERHE